MAKEYFQSKGTVVKWWCPESREHLAFELQKELLQWTMNQFNWFAKNVLEVGTGKGRFAVSAALNGADVYALDISKEMLKLAKEKCKKANVNVEFFLGDAENIPVKSNQFDIVICMETFMHLENPQKAAFGIERVLNEGGKAIVQTNNTFNPIIIPRSLRRIVKVLKRRFERERKNMRASPHWTHTVKQFINFFRGANLNIIKIRGQSLFHPSVPLFPKTLRNWFFEKIEDKFRESPLLYVMSKIILVVTKRIEYHEENILEEWKS